MEKYNTAVDDVNLDEEADLEEIFGALSKFDSVAFDMKEMSVMREPKTHVLPSLVSLVTGLLLPSATYKYVWGFSKN